MFNNLYRSVTSFMYAASLSWFVLMAYHYITKRNIFHYSIHDYHSIFFTIPASSSFCTICPTQRHFALNIGILLCYTTQVGNKILLENCVIYSHLFLCLFNDKPKNETRCFSITSDFLTNGFFFRNNEPKVMEFILHFTFN